MLQKIAVMWEVKSSKCKFKVMSSISICIFSLAILLLWFRSDSEVSTKQKIFPHWKYFIETYCWTLLDQSMGFLVRGTVKSINGYPFTPNKNFYSFLPLLLSSPILERSTITSLKRPIDLFIQETVLLTTITSKPAFKIIQIFKMAARNLTM